MLLCPAKLHPASCFSKHFNLHPTQTPRWTVPPPCAFLGRLKLVYICTKSGGFIDTEVYRFSIKTKPLSLPFPFLHKFYRHKFLIPQIFYLTPYPNLYLVLPLIFPVPIYVPPSITIYAVTLILLKFQECLLCCCVFQRTISRLKIGQRMA